MSVELLKFFLDIFVILFISLSVCLVLALAVHPFVPKAMLETYFKPPYFSRGEVVAFTGFPLGYIRTAMFMRLAGFPPSGKKRGLTEAYLLAPNWFRVFSRIFLTVFLINFIAFLLLLLILTFFVGIP